MNNDCYDFGEILKNLRKSRKLTQKQLAEKLNVTEGTISKYEKGTVYPPFDSIRSLSAILNVPVDTLLGTEVKNNISTFGLTESQIEIVIEMVDLFREKNSARKQRSEDYFSVLGKITHELHK